MLCYSNMADMSKAERLAAARRKLQDFQRKKDGPPVQNILAATTNEVQANPELFSTEPAKEDSYVEPQHLNNDPLMQSSSTYVSHNTSGFDPHYGSEKVMFGSEDQNGFQSENSFNEGSEATRTHPFTSAHVSDPGPSGGPSMFSASSYFNNSGGIASESFTAVGNIQDLVQGHSPAAEVAFQSTANFFSQNEETLNFYPSGNHTSDSFDSTKNFSSDNPSYTPPTDRISEIYPSSSEDSQPPENCVTSPPILEGFSHGKSTFSTNQEAENIIEGKETEISLNGCSSTESIRQLSDQITQLFDPSMVEEEKTNSTVIATLEARNQELAAQLANERRTNQQFQFSLRESQSQVSLLESKVQDLQSQQEVVLARHLGPLQDQLRAHAQTVGILVGEKTELEAAIAHHTTAAKQHASEVEELQNRLRASRHRVSELEKELISVSASATAAGKQEKNHAQELDQLRLQNGMLSKQREDAEEEASELRQKLSARVLEVGALSTQLQEKQSQLSLAQLRVTQLSTTDNPEASAEIESLHQLKISLERRCAELTEAVRQLSADRDQADQQYQQYVAQLNGQLQAANSKLEATSIENEKLKSRAEDLVRNMSELERQLQQQIQVQHQQQQQQLQQNIHQQIEPEEQSVAYEKYSLLEEEKKQLLSVLDLETQKLTSLQSELEEKDARIADLETLCNEQPDQSRLLAAMESDKVAAAQATSQNNVLKQQLQELQDGFIKMSNDKLHLTESLEHEKHVNKEMGEKISQLAEELHDLRVSVSDKERRLQEYRELEHHHEHTDCNENNHEHSHNHSDTIKPSVSHAGNEENSQSTSHLQEQLGQAHGHIHHLNSQNNNLHRLIAQKSTESHESGSSSSATEGATTDDAAADHDTNCEENDGQANYSCLQFAMDKLQERFSRTMAEVAELTDEKQRLEHLVLQLQGETETIGEYVTLYQMQRAALQQRAREKDHQLASLSAEREDLRRKLQELNQLVQRLLEDRGTETGKEALPSLQIANENQVNRNESDVIEVPAVSETVGQETTINITHDEAKNLITKKIMGIIEEIGSTNDMEGSFHPCPWCSGRLKNV